MISKETFNTADEARKDALKKNSFRRRLVSICQEEFVNSTANVSMLYVILFRTILYTLYYYILYYAWYMCYVYYYTIYRTLYFIQRIRNTHSITIPI